jgi:MATE family multidrug resistance protein
LTLPDASAPAPWTLRLRREVAVTGRLAAPIVGGQLALMGLSFTDTVMAGQLGAAALGAVAVGASSWSAVNFFVLGTLLAVPPFVSQMAAAGRRRAVGAFFRQVVWVALGLGLAAVAVVANLRPLLEAIAVEPAIVPTIEGYLRALVWGIPAWCLYLALRFTSEGLGETRPVLYFGLLGLPVNAVANQLFMFGAFGLPGLGAVGCGYATALVWTAQALAMALYVARRPAYRGLHLFARLDAPRPRRIGEVLRVGLPIAVTLFVEGSIFTAVALLLGSMGTEVVAGHMVALNFAAIVFMVPLGISMAMTVRVGDALGRRDGAALRFRAGVGIGLALVWQALAAAVMLALPRAVARIYTDDPAVVEVAVSLLFFAALFQLSDGVQVSAAAALRGIKDTRLPMLVVVVAYWLFGLPSGWWLAYRRGWGAEGMWAGLVVGLTVAAALLAVRFERASRRLAARL